MNATTKSKTTQDVDQCEPPSRTCTVCDGRGFYDGDGFSEDTCTCARCGGSGREATHDYVTRCERCGLDVEASNEYATGPCPRCGCDLRVRQ